MDGDVGVRADLARLRFTGEGTEPLPHEHISRKASADDA